jgi:hypothetical protein
MDEIRAKKYAQWILANKEKKGTPEFETVAKAYKIARGFAESPVIANEEKTEKKPEEEPSLISQTLGLPKEILKGFVRGITVDPASGLASLAYSGARATDPAMARFEETGVGKALAGAQEYLAPSDTGIITQLGAGIGSAASFIPGGLLKGGLKLATLAGQAAGIGSEEARQRAEQATLEGKPVTAGEQFTAQTLAVPVGLSELVPIQRVVRPLKAVLSKVKASDIEKYAPDFISTTKRVLATSGEEAAQEYISNISQDLIQKGVYDPNLEIGKSALSDAGMGATVGGILQTGVEALTRGKTKEIYRGLKKKEEDKKLAEFAEKKRKEQEEKDAQTIERLGVKKGVLALPAPPKQIEEDEKEIDNEINPIGFISRNEFSEDIAKQIDDQRKADGKTKLNKFSIEDLADANVPQQNIDSILAAKTGYTSDTKITAQDVLNIAAERNIDTQTDGFSDFLSRTTGTNSLENMTQPQLYATFKSLSNLEKTEFPRFLPSGTNAKRFTEDQYNKSLEGIKKFFPNTGRLGRKSVIQEIKEFSGLENDRDAESLLNTAIKNGEFSLVRNPIYHVADESGNIRRSYKTRESASRAALKENLSVIYGSSVDVAIPYSISDLDEVSAGLGALKLLKEDIGLDIREGKFQTGTTPSAFAITTEDGKRVGLPHSNIESAKKALDTIFNFRKKEAENLNAQAEQRVKRIEANNNSLLKMQAIGNVSEVDLNKASANITAKNKKLEQEANSLRKQAEDYSKPLVVSPKGEKPVTKKGFTFFENDVPVATFGSIEQAEKSLLARRTDEELASIIKKAERKGGVGAKRIISSAQQEMAYRSGKFPVGLPLKYRGIKKNAEARLEEAGIFTPELRAKAEELSKKLRPILDKLGLKDLRLNIGTIIRTAEGGEANGAYTRKLIEISLRSEDPIKTLRHEAIHALKELGAFTESQWRVLENKAKSEWIQKYNIAERYKGLTTEEQIEEAIADAFSDFSTRPPVGMIGAIVNKIKKFFEAFRNSMNDLGFQTYEDVFSATEEGGLTPVSLKEKAGETLIPIKKYQLKHTEDKEIFPYATAAKLISDAAKKDKQKIKIERLADFFDDYHKKIHGGRKLNQYDDEDFSLAAKEAAKEIEFQLQQAQSGMGWYDEDIKKTFLTLSEIDLFKDFADDENKRVLWSAIAAANSNGLLVSQNAAATSAVMKKYFETGEIETTPPEKDTIFAGLKGVGWGARQKTVAQSLKIIKYLLERLGEDGFSDWWLSNHTMKEMLDIRKAVGLSGAPAGMRGGLDSLHLGAKIIGDKIGPFSLNINGFDGVTKDVWFTRFYNRHFGSMRGGKDNKVLNAPRNTKERDRMELFAKEIKNNLPDSNLSLRDIQAILWFFEQNLYTSLGVKSIPGSFSKGAQNVVNQIRAGVFGSDASKAPFKQGVQEEKSLRNFRIVSERQRQLRAERRNFLGRPVSGEADPRYLDKKPKTYEGRIVEDDGGVRLLSFVPNKEIERRFNAAGLNVPEVKQISSTKENAEKYHQDMVDAMSKNEYGAQVEIKKPEDLQKYRMFRTANGSGFAIKDDGDIVAVFASPTELKNSSYAMLQAAIQAGGLKLDAFNTFLPEIYQAVGFKPESRMSWNEDYIPPAWDKKTFKKWQDGEPDVVYFAYTPNYFEKGVERAKLVEDPDEAARIQDAAAKRYKEHPDKIKYSLKQIEVDGVSRPTTNSEGRPIANTEESLINFWRWFGDSKAVDEQGRPKVYYHGTSKDVDFSNFKIGQRGAWFSEDPKVASSYASENDSRKLVFDFEKRKYVEKNTADRVIPAYLKIENPMRLSEADRQKLIKSESYAKAQRDVYMLRGNADGHIEGSVAVVFSPTQIKSATGNTGAFSAKNKNIKYSIKDRIPTDINNDIERTTSTRQEEGYQEKIAEAISPVGFTKFRQAFLNRYESIERLAKRVAARFGDRELLADQSAIAAALISDRAAGVAASAYINGVPVYRNGAFAVSDYNGSVKGLITILEPLAKYGDPFVYQAFQYYAGAKRAKRLRAEGREKLFEENSVQNAEVLGKEFPEFEQVLQELQKFNNGLVQFMKNTGVISDKDADIWTENWDYIPFYRQMDGEKTLGPKIFQSITGVEKPKKLKGGEGKLDDFLETVIRNTRAAIESGMKNVAAQRVVRDIVRMDEGELVSHNHPMEPDIVAVKENGVTKKYRVNDPLLVESLKSLNMAELPFLSVLAKPAEWLRNLVTKDPGFMLVNLMRDSLQAYIASGTDMKPMIDTFKQYVNALANSSPEVRALKESGMFTGYEFSGDIKASAKAVAKELRKKTGTRTLAEKAALPISSVWEMLDKGSNASDIATRAEIYKRTMEETGNEAEALYRSLEVMNFGRKGNSAVIRIVTALIPFLNARIQGLDVLYRAGFGKGAIANRQKQQKSFAIRAATMFALSTMYWFAASDDEEYKNAEQETRDNNWIVNGIKIPIPFELGVLFKVFPERLAAYYFGDDTAEDLKKSIYRNITSTLAINPVPQAVLPLYENKANYSFFTGEPIVGMGQEGLAEKYQSRQSTSRLAKELGDKFDYSPLKIDNLIRGYTGTLGTYAVMAIDAIMSGEGEPTKATLKFEQMPVFKRFIASKDASGTVSSYYDLKAEVDRAVRTMNYLERTGNYEDLKDYLTGPNAKLIAIRPYINELNKNMTELREMKNMVYLSKMSSDRKRDVLSSITKAENKLTSRIQYIKKFIYK